VVEDAEEAVALANDSEYGLTASLFTRDERRARALARRLRVGTVVVNDSFGGASSPEVPWGGVKSSGIGRTLGPEGLHEFTTTKTVSVDRLGLGRDVQWYPYRPSTLRWMRRVGRLLFAR
ncbi:MAG: aldehyde dehydrogenase, partial [Myxococcales bacterium]|nr:aldehyde dehydrogenase [Myxococcales bacterium]